MCHQDNRAVLFKIFALPYLVVTGKRGEYKPGFEKLRIGWNLLHDDDPGLFEIESNQFFPRSSDDVGEVGRTIINNVINQRVEFTDTPFPALVPRETVEGDAIRFFEG